MKYDYVQAHGNVGGVLVLWGERKLECLEVNKSEFLFHNRCEI